MTPWTAAWQASLSFTISSSNSHPLNWWCHPAILSSVESFSSCLLLLLTVVSTTTLHTTTFWVCRKFSFFLKIKKYIYIIYFCIWLHQALVAALGIIALCGIIAAHWFSSCGSQAQLFHVCGTLVPWPGVELTSPALQGRFLTTGTPGKSQEVFILVLLNQNSASFICKSHRVNILGLAGHKFSVLTGSAFGA